MATNGAAHAPIPSTEPSAHFPTPLPASTVQHVDPPAVTAEQEAMLQDLIDYLSSPTYEIPSLLKAFKAYQKARGHPSRPLRDESGSGASSMASTSSLQVKDVKLMPLTDVERCWLSRERASIGVSPLHADGPRHRASPLPARDQVDLQGRGITGRGDAHLATRVWR